MMYQSLSDMMLDLRRSLEKAVGRGDANETLATYDYAVQKALEEQACRVMFEEEVKRLLGEDAYDAVQRACTDRWKELLTVGSEYRYDVEHGRKVGYSAAEEEGKGNDE